MSGLIPALLGFFAEKFGLATTMALLGLSSVAVLAIAYEHSWGMTKNNNCKIDKEETYES